MEELPSVCHPSLPPLYPAVPAVAPGMSLFRPEGTSEYDQTLILRVESE